jgi:hypothetical protein
VAKLAMISISVAGLAALAALFSSRWKIATRVFQVVVLLLAIASGGLMAQTAHLGGQIRHTEMRNSAAFQDGSENGEQNKNNADQQQQKDDD